MTNYLSQKTKHQLQEIVEDFMISYLLKAKDQWWNNMVNYIQALQELDVFNKFWLYELFLNSPEWKHRNETKKNVLRTWIMKANSYINYQSIKNWTFSAEWVFNDNPQSIGIRKYSIEKHINEWTKHDFFSYFKREHVVALPRRMATLKIILSEIYHKSPKSFKIIDIGGSLGAAKQVLTHWFSKWILNEHRKQNIHSLCNWLHTRDFDDIEIKDYCVIDKNTNMSSKENIADSRSRATAGFRPVWINLEYMKYNQIIQDLQEKNHNINFIQADALNKEQITVTGKFTILFLSFTLFEMNIDYNTESQKVFDLRWEYLEDGAHIIIQDISSSAAHKWFGKVPVLIYKKKSSTQYQYLWSPIALGPDHSTIVEIDKEVLDNLI